MQQVISVGNQDFVSIRENNYFYIDKTSFIKEWWENGDSVTLITRPRRFGKTLNMSMVETFFSNTEKEQAKLFEDLEIWKDKKYQKLQGSYPVLFLSFATVKEPDYEKTRRKICQLITNLYMKYHFLIEEDFLKDKERDFYESVSVDMDDNAATMALYQLSDYLSRYYGKKVLILLDENENAIWSLLLASGYLKVHGIKENEIYTLSLTNLEVLKMFDKMIQGWFSKPSARYNDFMKALRMNDINYMNRFMNQMTETVFSYFDTGGREPEKFYHGFVLGLIADAKGEYTITSNRESGFGRYDVLLEPKDRDQDAYIFEFKVQDTLEENTLQDTVDAALKQIEEKHYDAQLLAKGMKKEKIRHYGFAFCGKKVLIGK